MRILALFSLIFLAQAQAQEFNYGLWGNSQQERKVQPKVKIEKKPAGRSEKREAEFSWRDFLPRDVPRPFVKLLENPSPENVRKYWKAYEEFVTRITDAERQVKLLQLEFARRISARYELYYFFSPGCPACRKYSPVLFARLLKEGFEVPVKAFVVGNLQSGRIFASALGISTVRAASPELLSQLGVSSLPTAVLLEGDRVVAKYSGSSVLELVTFLKEKRDEEISSSSNSSDER